MSKGNIQIGPKITFSEITTMVIMTQNIHHPDVKSKYTHTYTHTYIYVNMSEYMCASVYVCVYSDLYVTL